MTGTTPSFELDSVQAAAVESRADRILCVAGPGSGKTAVLIARIKRLLAEGVNPSSIAVISFTNAAAKELLARLDGHRLGYCGTLHGLALRICQQWGESIGFGPKIGVLDEDQAKDMLQRSVEALKYKGSMQKVLAEIAAGPGNSPPIASMNAVQLVVIHFFHALRTANLMTFDTLLHFALKVVNTPGFSTPYQFLFVDEFQDSSDLDAEIYRALPIENKYLTGDGDQSIYTFRGANVGNILAAAATFEVHRLENNYRSDRAICQTAQRLIENNRKRVAKATVSVSTEPGSVVATYHTTAAAELAFIASTISPLIQNGQSCAILCRTNALASQITQYLTGLGVPVQKRNTVDLPGDWRRTKNLIGLLADPDNDTLAAWVIADSHGKAKADDARLQSQAAGESINQRFLRIPTGIELADVPSVLARATIDQEAIAIVQKAIELLPPGSGVSDLVYALSEIEHTKTESGEGVAVTTLHGSKGREFDIVFLPAFEQEVIPGTRRSTDIEEDRRLAYVGITRARHTVFISHCGERPSPFGGGHPMKSTPSQFIAEAGL